MHGGQENFQATDTVSATKGDRASDVTTKRNIYLPEADAGRQCRHHRRTDELIDRRKMGLLWDLRWNERARFDRKSNATLGGP